jgi:predicted anti-sigma-YlaC factor YlaD
MKETTMECDELLTYLSDYIDNDLDGELTREARQHLQTCHNCRVVLNSTEQLIILYREQGHQVIPGKRRQRLFSELEAAFEKRTQPQD